MPRKITVFLLGFVFFISCNSARAQVIFNEIAWMGTSAHANCEWIELYNNGSEVDLTGWAIYEQGGSVKIIDLSGTIGGNSYLLVERVTGTSCPDPVSGLNDISGSFGGSGLVNTPGEFLVIKDSTGATEQSLDFSSGWPAGDAVTKNTMQWNGSSWVTGAPTPKTENQTSSSGDEEGNTASDEEEETSSGGSSASNSSNSSSSKSSSKSETLDKKVKILAPKIVFTNVPFEIKGSSDATGGRYFWNFGDGNSKDSRESTPFPYTYFYEGEYVVTLEYYPKTFSKTPDSTAKVTVKAVPMEISISRVGEADDFFVELSNGTSYEVDISQWALSSVNKNFIFPRNTTILPKKKLILSSKVTGFSIADKNTLELLNKEGGLVYNYNYGGLPPVSREISVKKAVKRTSPILNFQEESASLDNLEVFLPAASIKAEEDAPTSYIYTAGLAILILISSASVYFIRKRVVNDPKNEDFELVD